MKKVTDLAVISTELIGDIRTLIEETRSAVAVTVNAGLTMLYWRIGKRVNEEILKGKRLIMERRLSQRCRDNWRQITDVVSVRKIYVE